MDSSLRFLFCFEWYTQLFAFLCLNLNYCFFSLLVSLFLFCWRELFVYTHGGGKTATCFCDRFSDHLRLMVCRTRTPNSDLRARTGWNGVGKVSVSMSVLVFRCFAVCSVGDFVFCPLMRIFILLLNLRTHRRKGGDFL